jgi:hypothetical protein
MIIICGKTIAEVERDLELAKQAIASGAKVGIGGATLADVEKAMEMLHSAVGGEVAITNPNYIGVPPVEDEDEDEICPNCGAWWDGYYCENCGYDPDNEDECCGCDECDCECGHSCCKCEDEDEVDPASAFIQWLEQMGAPLDIISVAKGMFQ